jgi:plasmid stabilization system protein ParE
MLPVIFHRLAKAELRDAADFYAARASELQRDALISEVERITHVLSRKPMVGQLVRRDCRRAVLKRFPYSVIYRVLPDHIQIVAVAAQARRPGYWANRR